MFSNSADAKAAGAKYYTTGKPCKNGHIGPRYTSGQSCVECSKLRHQENMKSAEYRDGRNANQAKRYAEDENLRERLKKYRDELRSTAEFWERENARQRERRASDPEYRDKLNAYQRKYSSDPKRKAMKKEADAARYLVRKADGKYSSEERKEYMRSYMRDRMAADPGFRVNVAFGAALRQSLKAGKEGRNWEAMAGYTLAELRDHLEGKFLPGMTWENYGRNGWHIDHIIPKSVFNFETPDDIDFQRCWSLSNLQPLWQADNISKKDKLTADFQPSLLIGAKRPTNAA